MKQSILALTLTVSFLSSCGSSNPLASKASTAAALISQLTPNSKAGQIASLFSMLDTNKDQAVSKTEASGTMVSENFGKLDSDKNNLLNVSELTGLLGLLKK